MPAGRFRFGYAGDDDLRRLFFYSPPAHTVSTAAFHIARNETTFGEWLAFLDALPAGERAAHLPTIIGSGTLALDRTDDGWWKLALQPTVKRFEAVAGEPITYAGRTDHVTVDWRRLPVTGVSVPQAQAYAAWRRSRLCTSHEWQRAARGADERLYPHGDQLRTGEANTYDSHRSDALETSGPDEIGAHPRSRSPFDLDDIAGNAWELLHTATGDGFEVRGSAWYFDPFNAQVVNRQPQELAVQDIMVGFRLCADP